MGSEVRRDEKRSKEKETVKNNGFRCSTGCFDISAIIPILLSCHTPKSDLIKAITSE